MWTKCNKTEKKTKKNLPSFADGWPGRRQSDKTFADGQPSAKPFLFKIKIKKRKKVLCRRLVTLAVGKDRRQLTASVAPLPTAKVAVGKALPAV
jgi:hypothetical protein